MGDRAVVYFVTGKRDAYRGYFSCGIYLHWDRASVVMWLKEAQPRLRKMDESYAAARFAQFCADKMDQSPTAIPLSLGLLPPLYMDGSRSDDDGGGAIFIVDLDTGSVMDDDGGLICELDPALFYQS